jgi:glycerol-3-phosphate dehydrogenase
MDAPFSATTRRAALEAMASETLDVLVVGGGITGAGIARDAAMRGLRTAVVDGGDFGGGTSSRSSRLVHGGLRYLEHGWLRLVFEASRERTTLLRIAPHLVRACPFTFPVYRGGRRPVWQIWAGVWLYDALALFRNAHRARLLGRRGVLQREPLLRERGLTGGAEYWDAQTDDFRLTLATMRSAHRHAALCASYSRVLALEKASGAVRGATIEDVLDGTMRTVHAHVVVNATGPWSDRLRRLDDPAAPPLLRPTKGAHIAVPRARLGNAGAVTLTSPIDGRVMFVLPWGSVAVVGTTDTDSDESPDEVAPTRDDVIYLVRSANAVFPNARLQESDVLAAWAGLRPLLRDGGATTAAVPREHRIVESDSGLISIAGGKLTTYRVMAAQVVDRVARRLHQLDHRPVPPRASTDQEPLPGGDVADVGALEASLAEDGIAPRVARRLVWAYGSEAGAVARLVREEPALGELLTATGRVLAAEVVFQAQREMALSLGDVLIRRTSLVQRDAPGALAAAPVVAALLGRELGWDARARTAALAAFRDQVSRMLGGFRAPT